ncbi:MAG: hypothetical protein J3K34DRAFT_432739 [Monoraphidium minutum]|nr:MAG: hypothetical protein J3K34DRAFT_432739 [Monoraphidium minutum]
MPPGPTVLPDLADDVLFMIAGAWEKSLIYDESDISRDAAALMCVGHPLFTALGSKVYGVISPFLDRPPIEEDGKATDMKALLKEWELPHTGNKAVLWARIEAEVEGVSEHCPISRGAKERAIKQQTEHMSAHRCRTAFGLSKSEIKNLPAREEQPEGGFVRGFGGFGYMDVIRTYSLKVVKEVARKSYYWKGRDWKRVEASLQASKTSGNASKRESKKAREAARATLVAAVVARGTVSEYGADAVSRRFLPAIFEYEYGFGGGRTEAKLKAAADEVELYHFLFTQTDFTHIKSTMEQEFRASRGKISHSKVDEAVSRLGDPLKRSHAD